MRMPKSVQAADARLQAEYPELAAERDEILKLYKICGQQTFEYISKAKAFNSRLQELDLLAAGIAEE